MSKEAGKTFIGWSATTEPFLLRWCLEQLLVKWEGTWGPEHSDCNKGEDLFAEILSFLPTRSKRGKQQPHELILSVDTTAALWRDISCSWETGQLLLQNRVSNRHQKSHFGGTIMLKSFELQPNGFDFWPKSDFPLSPQNESNHSEADP